MKELKEKGKIERDYWLGILKVQDLTPYIAHALGIKTDQGVIIAQIEPKSPADKAGLKVEDVIIALNGQRVNSAQELIDVLQNSDLRVGDVLTFDVVRGDRKLKFKVKLEPLPD